MRKIFFLLLIPLFLGVGCAAHKDNIKELFDESLRQCRVQSPKGCSGDFRIETGKATDIGSNMIQLNGEIIPIDATVMWWFEYGPNSDRLIYTTEPKVVGGVGPMKVSVHLKKLAPMTKYYYRVVAQNKKGKIYGATYFEATVDKSCFGPGMWATFFGTGMTAGGIALGSPELVISGLATTATGIFDGSFYGNEADARCKEVAGVVGATAGYFGGRSYKNSHKASSSSSAPSEGDGGTTGGETGPATSPAVP